MLRIRSPALGASGTPTPAAANIGPRQSLADQRVADVASVHRHLPQLAAVDVLVAVDAGQGYGLAVEQSLQPVPRAGLAKRIATSTLLSGVGGIG